MPKLWQEERGNSEKWEPDGDEEEEGRPALLPLALLFLLFFGAASLWMVMESGEIR